MQEISTTQQPWAYLKRDLDRAAQEGHQVTLNITVIQSPSDEEETLCVDAHYTLDGQPYVRTFFNVAPTDVSLTPIQRLLPDESAPDVKSLCLLAGNYIADQLPNADADWEAATLVAEFEDDAVQTYGRFGANEAASDQYSFPTDYRAAILLNALGERLGVATGQQITNISTTIRPDGAIGLSLGLPNVVHVT